MTLLALHASEDIGAKERAGDVTNVQVAIGRRRCDGDNVFGHYQHPVLSS